MASRQRRAPWVAFAVVLWVFANNGLLPAVCGVTDAPDCGCFNNAGGTWNPTGIRIHSVAAQTMGVTESCVADGGKPYYQMQLGIKGRDWALYAADLMALGLFAFDPREAWCSETISFWHMQAKTPYLTGYRNTWYHSWKIKSSTELRDWYEEEEDLGGRGRWLRPSELSYDPFELGLTMPIPGAYVAIRRFDATTGQWLSGGAGLAHSLLVDEMWVHVDNEGNVFRVDVTLLEGNAGAAGTVQSGERWNHILSMVPGGTATVDTLGRSIYGFGIPLNSNGQAWYEQRRVHYIYYYTPPAASPWRSDSESAGPNFVDDFDPDWVAFEKRRPLLTAYATKTAATGPLATSSSNVVLGPIPDGAGHHWQFFANTSPVVVDIDLLDVHPYGIRGIEMTWTRSFPRAATISFSADGAQYHVVQMPSLANVVPRVGVPLLVPVRFGAQGESFPMRYVRLEFPAGAFESAATLRDLTFSYEPGPIPDAESNYAPGDTVEVDVDVKPGSCPNPINVKSRGVLPVGVTGGSVPVTDIDPATVRLEGVAPVRWSYSDVGANGAGQSCACSMTRPDGVKDLVLHFDTEALVARLGDVRSGDPVTLHLTGALRDTAVPIAGEDCVVVVGARR